MIRRQNESQFSNKHRNENQITIQHEEKLSLTQEGRSLDKKLNKTNFEILLKDLLDEN